VRAIKVEFRGKKKSLKLELTVAGLIALGAGLCTALTYWLN